MIQHSNIFEEAVKGTRERSSRSFEVLYLLTCKQIYLDIRFSELNESTIRETIIRTYVKIWQDADTIPGGELFQEWIRERISEAYWDTTKERIEVFPDSKYKVKKEIDEKSKSELLLKIEERCGMFNPAEDDEYTVKAGIRTSIEETRRRTGENRIGTIKAIITLIIAAALTVVATLIVLNVKDEVEKTDQIQIGEIENIIETAKSIESETLAPPER